MGTSFRAMDRIIEEEAAANESYRKQLEKVQKPLLSMGRRMSDEQLLEKLRSLNVHLDRATLREWCRKSPSAEALARRLAREPDVKAPGAELDWLWIGLAVLWERWFPEQTNFEMLDDKMQAGYAAIEEEDEGRGCEIWLDAWHHLLAFMDTHNVDTLKGFDERFGPSQDVFNWVQDLTEQLWNAGLEDVHLLRQRIAVCEEAIRRWPGESSHLTESLKADMAETWFTIGQTERAAALFQQWLKDDPQWGWGWIRWADCYAFAPAKKEKRDPQQAERILKQGLAVADVRDRRHILDRLADLYEQTGRSKDADALRDDIQSLPAVTEHVEISRVGNVLKAKSTLDFGDEGIPVDRLGDVAEALGRPPVEAQARTPRVGRNDPCPCGSGKKYKKCCGRKPQK